MFGLDRGASEEDLDAKARLQHGVRVLLPMHLRIEIEKWKAKEGGGYTIRPEQVPYISDIIMGRAFAEMTLPAGPTAVTKLLPGALRDKLKEIVRDTVAEQVCQLKRAEGMGSSTSVGGRFDRPHPIPEDVLARYKLDFRRIGASILFRRAERLSALQHIGANGGGEEEEDQGHANELGSFAAATSIAGGVTSRGGNGKRKRAAPITREERRWLEEMQPELKRLAAVAIDPDFALRYVEMLLQFSDELRAHIIDFLLQPTLLTAAGVDQPGVEREKRMEAAVLEVRVRKAAFTALLRVSNAHEHTRPLYDELLYENTRRRAYLIWLRRRTAPLWVGADRYEGPRFSDADLAKFRERLPPFLAVEDRLVWYDHFLANVVVHWHLGELARELWVTGLTTGERPRELGAWPGAREIWKGEFAVAISLSRWRDPLIEATVGGFGVEFRGPTDERAWSDEVVSVDEIPWAHGMPTTRVMSLTVMARAATYKRFAIFMGRQTRRVTLLRIPSILWDLDKHPQASGIGGTPKYHVTRLAFEPTGTRRRHPYLLFDEPLRAYDPKTSRGPWVFDLVHRPRLNKNAELRLRGLRFFHTDNITRGLGRWARSLRLHDSSLSLKYVTLFVADLGPTLYLPDRGGAGEFAVPREFGAHLDVYAPMSAVWPVPLRNEEGEPIEQLLRICMIDITFVGPAATEKAEGVTVATRLEMRGTLTVLGPQAPMWAHVWVGGIRGQTDVPAWLAEVRTPFHHQEAEEADVEMEEEGTGN